MSFLSLMGFRRSIRTMNLRKFPGERIMGHYVIIIGRDLGSCSPVVLSEDL